MINEDIFQYHTDKKFDLIICISTLEHIGWDELPEDKNKPIEVIKKLKSMLNSNGTIFFSIP